MLSRILSFAAPLSVYLTAAVLASALYRERRRFEWLSLVPAALALTASFLVVPQGHQLFFDEDIYINIAANLAEAPVYRVTLFGGPHQIDASTYYKEPSGFPVLLSFVFFFTGVSESAAHLFSRFIYATAVASIYFLARAISLDKGKAITAALVFAAVPVSFWFSASSGTDLSAALFATLGIIGVTLGTGPLAAAGLALASQIRLEMIALVPLLLSPVLSRRWQLVGFGLVATEVVHILWVFSIQPLLARAENVDTAFSVQYVGNNITANLGYLLDPMLFPAVVFALAIFAVLKLRGVFRFALIAWPALLFAVYVLFYAGNFNANPRYAIQLAAPLAVLAASTISNRWACGGLVLLSFIPYLRDADGFNVVLRSDHDFAIEQAQRLGEHDLMVTTEPEVFFNQRVSALNAVFASERGTVFIEEQRERFAKLWYYSGVRAGMQGSQQSAADRWMKANFELELVETHEAFGQQISSYIIGKPTSD